MVPADRLEHPTEARTWKGSIPVWHRYTAGIAGERFLRVLKEQGKIMGARCGACEVTYVPPRMYCERCLKPLPDASWKEVGPRGELVSFTRVYLDLDGEQLKTPRWVGLVRLEGASGVLLHYLQLPEGVPLRPGIQVEAVLKPAGERRGSILDIEHWKVV
ncbi:MAG: Zn-ribbon domain-containing OB-fold protein [Anaerolineales bacterium]|jgi:uncharacterized OB-fold protein